MPFSCDSFKGVRCSLNLCCFLSLFDFTGVNTVGKEFAGILAPLSGIG
jgi:hypothetical protein